MVDLCLLGTGGGMPMPYRDLSATLINFKGRKILIDCGEGTQVAMRKIGWGFKSIDVICISHCHGDHIIGIPGLLSTMGNSGREEPITIIGPKRIKSVIEGLKVACPYLPYDINIIEDCKDINLKLHKDSMEVIKEYGDINIKTLELEHSTNCMAYSFYFKRTRKFNREKAEENEVPKILWSKLQKGEEAIFEKRTYLPSEVLGEERKGIKLSFVTDSRPIETIEKFICESDLFICEGTYGSDIDKEKAIKNKHMTFAEAATLAKNGRVEQLLLTHFSPANLEPKDFIENASSIFKEVIIGEDRLTKTLTYRDS